MPLSLRAAVAALALAAPLSAQGTADPYPDPIPASEGAIRVDVADFATLPDIDGEPARMMLLVDEPGTRRLFVNDMRGPLYSVSYDGRSVVEYLDLRQERWGVGVQSSGRERGFQSFALHPEFGQTGAPGHGKLYTWTDVEDTAPEPDFRPTGGDRTHHLVLLEWTARDATAPTYDGGPPRELLRVEQPFANHNGGRIAFDPLARPGDADFGLLYVGLADGGSGGDPLNHAQDLGSPFGKILRIDPLGTDAASGRYGIPAANPFAGDDDPGTLAEIFAYGLRNPQHLAWDRATGRMFVTDIGQGTVEEVSAVAAGANLGWNAWEGSFRYLGRGEVSAGDARGDGAITYPVAEYGQADPLLQGRSAVTGLAVYRDDAVPALRGRLIFGDLPSGEIFHVPADEASSGGQGGVRRVLLNDGGEARTLLQLIQARNAAQGREPAARADLRLHAGDGGRLFLLNKADGVIRVLGG